MSTHPDPKNFFKDFLEDYFAECEDHLTVVRRELLEIEPFVGKAGIERSVLNELFRSFHSLKGLSGMVGVKEAEELAHEMESYLRVLRDQEVILSPEGFDALLGGTKGLEQTIAAHRHEKPSPDISQIVAALKAVTPQTEKAGAVEQSAPVAALQLKAEDITRLQRATETPGVQAWHFIFTPTQQLSTNGINVNKIRDRLQSLGELIYAAPRMTPEGKIAFDFLLVNALNPNTFIGWENDGLTWAPYLASEKNPHPEAESPNPTIPQSPETAPLNEPDPVSPGPGQPTPISPPIAAPLISQSSNVVRVDLPKLDELMRIMGDLVITRSRLSNQLTHLQEQLPVNHLRPLVEINQILERQLRDLREGVMRVRLVPIGEIFARMQFVVRDLVRETPKQVQVELSGQETEIDKFVVERMMDPLLHLVRNAVSHGLETIEERLQAGKPTTGKIALRAKTCGEMVIIEVEDDGRGIHSPQILQKASSQNLLPQRPHPHLNPQPEDPTTLLEILCTPGFSTREVADLASGRGVGMAIVKNTLQELGGTLTLETHTGQGTKFIIELPLTLAIADVLLLSLGPETYAISASSVREAIALPAEAITVFEQTLMIPYRGKIIPLLRLESLFNLIPTESTPGEPPVPPDSTASAPTPSSPHSALFTGIPQQHAPSYTRAIASNWRVVIVSSGPNTVGIAVDRIIGQREIVVRPLNDPLVQVLGISGATEIGDGRVILILDAPALMRAHHPQPHRTS
ncbi:chemotaxis protein CheA [Laspinema palackyanum]|uniref:chemotaxis protein CheA n=1 Tax=Laspinema palackyanum TaxID=3231601 RepID=UPI00345C6879|nr:chemotaxis protein CheA [Laspinema sp. D2c]